MDKRANIMQQLGAASRATGSIGGPTAPSIYKGWGGPVAGAAIKGLAVGLPMYGLTRLGLKATGKDKDWDAHRTALLAGLAGGLGAGAMDWSQMGENFQNAPGGVLKGLKNLNKDPGTFAQQPEGYPGKVTAAVTNLFGKKGDYNGSMRGTQGGSVASAEGGNWDGAAKDMHTKASDQITEIMSGIRHRLDGSKPKGDTEMYASSDSGGPIKPSPEMVSGNVVKEALARVRKYLGTVPISKKADYDNESGGYMDYDTFVPPGYQQTIPAHYTMSQIENDPYLAPQEKARAMMHLDNASGGRPGLITVNDITKAVVGAGIGYASANLFGRVLGGLFGGLSPQTQRSMQQGGAIAGLLVNTGALR